MGATRRTMGRTMGQATVRQHKRRIKGGKVVRVRKHARAVAYGAGARNGIRGRGTFQARRGFRHMTGRRANGRNINRRHRKKIAFMVGLGMVELLAWAIFRTLGITLATLALLLSAGAIAAGKSTATPRRRGKGRSSTARAKAKPTATPGRHSAYVAPGVRRGTGKTAMTTKNTPQSRARRAAKGG